MKYLIITLLFIISFTAATAQQLELSDANKPIIVEKSHPTVNITLRSNPTTGYSWYLVNYDRDLLVPLKHKFIPPDKLMPGAPGYESWQFELKAAAFVMPQVLEIALSYVRPWEKNNLSLTTFRVITHD